VGILVTGIDVLLVVPLAVAFGRFDVSRDVPP
jgi:hypothetical protein